MPTRTAPRNSADGRELGTPGTVREDHIAGLDGVRAISILLVMVGHYGFGEIVPGGLGVTIFFFVSGFLITTLLLREFADSGAIDLRNFYVRRLLRIAPEMIAFVLITLVIGVSVGMIFRPMELVAALFYFTNYYSLFNGLCSYDVCVGWHMLWSLSIEEHFYLLFPLCLLLLARNPRRLLGFLTAVLILDLVWRLVVVFGLNLNPNWTYKASDARLDSIAYGCWLAVVFAHFPDLLAGAERRGRLIAVAAAGILLLSLAVRDPYFRDTARYSLQGIAIGLAFVALYATPVGARGVTLLGTAPMAWMGRLSYGAYLWHFVPLDLALWYLDVDHAADVPTQTKWLVGPLSTAATFGLAWLSYVLLARPVLQVRHRFGPRADKSRPVAAAPAAITERHAAEPEAGRA